MSFEKKIKQKNEELYGLRQRRRSLTLRGFQYIPEIKFKSVFEISQNERIVFAYYTSTSEDLLNHPMGIPIYIVNNKNFLINGEILPNIPIKDYEYNDKKVIQPTAIFNRSMTNQEFVFDINFEKITNYKSVASIKKYELSDKLNRLNEFSRNLLNKVKETKINELSPKPKSNILKFTLNTGKYPYRSYKKLTSLYDDFDNEKYKEVEHYNNFNVKESKKDYSLKTYSKYKYTFIGDIFFQSNKAAFLLLINVNTRYAYAYQLGEVNIKETINVDENNKEYEVSYLTTGKKTNNELMKAFEKHLKICPIHVLRFDGEKAVNSKEFKKFFKDHKIMFIPATTEAHTSLSLIDRLCRTIRDIAFNLNYEGIFTQEQMDFILNFYNNARHETLTKTIFKSHPEIKQQLSGNLFSPPPFISPSMVNESDELEKIFVEECMKYNYSIMTKPDYHIDKDDIVKITSEKDKLGKKRSILDKDYYKLVNKNGNIYELLGTTTNKKAFKPRFEIFNFY